jgi:membrane-associated phospholipid phosphatase
MKNFFIQLFVNLKAIYFWPNTIWHLVLFGLTFLSLFSGFDWQYSLVTRGINMWFWLVAGVVGGLLPILLPFVLYAVGQIIKERDIKITALALGQAVILGSFTSSLYKAFTGRIPPDLTNIVTDISHGFRFGFWEGGIFWGWPSSHTTIAFAMAVTFLVMYPKKTVMKYFVLLYAAYIGFGASIGFHWFSEVVGGVVLGSIVGLVVGSNSKLDLSIHKK